MKRSRITQLILLGLAPLTLTACDDSATSQVSEHPFKSVTECVAAGVDQNQCQKASDQAAASAETSAPKYKTRADCIADYGEDMCQPRHDSHGNDFFGPLATGFLISQMMSGGHPVYTQAQPIYRQRDGNDFRPYQSSYSRDSYSGSGSSYGTSRPSGSDRSAYGSSYRGSSDSAGTRAVTASRGGFGSVSSMRGSMGG